MGLARSLRVRVELCLVLSIFGASGAAADDRIGPAQEFLRATQLPGGGFAGIPLIDAAEAAAVLDSPLHRDLALFALSQARPDNNEAALARVDALLGTELADRVGAEALLRTMADGDFGLAPGWNDVDVLLAARALRFAAKAPFDLRISSVDPATLQVETSSVYGLLIPKLLARLTGAQRPDGGFGFADEASDVAVTCEVAIALASLPGDPTAAAMLGVTRAWLGTQQLSVQQSAASDLALYLLGSGVSPAAVPALVAALES